jgi:broad specificity phosphatase PhoE
MTELILIRHGKTDWNIEGRYQGQSDVPLNPSGLKQAEELAQELRHEAINAIFSSDLARARQTAQILSHINGAPLYLDRRLREIHQGEWEGMLFDHIRTRYTKAFEERLRDPLQVAPPGGETVGQVRERVLEATHEIITEYPHGLVAIVSHGLSLAIIKVHYNKLAIETVWDHIPENTVPERIIVEAR